MLLDKKKIWKIYAIISVPFLFFSIFFSIEPYSISHQIKAVILLISIVLSYLLLSLLIKLKLPNSNVSTKFQTSKNEKLIGYALLLIPIGFSVYWFLLENHGIYGDEAAHYQYLIDAIYSFKHTPGILSRIKILYIFNFRYPPALYLSSLPLIRLVGNWVLGGRLFVLMMNIINLILFFKLLRIYFGIIPTIISCLVLNFGFQYLLVSRYYGQEILMITVVFGLLLSLEYYLNSFKNRYIFISALLAAFGFLVKYNFILYFTPVLFFLLFRLRSLKVKPSECVSVCVILLIPSVVLSLPWYIYSYVTSPQSNAIQALIAAKQRGYYAPNKSLLQSLLALFQSVPKYFSYFEIYLLIILFILFIAFLLHGRNKTIKGLGIASFALITSFFVDLMLEVLSISALRWYFSYFLIPILFAFFLENIRFGKKINVVFSTLIIIILIVSTYNNTVEIFIKNQQISNLLSYTRKDEFIPKILPTGAEEAVLRIKQDWVTEHTADEKITVGFVGHIHEGLHGHAFAFYGKQYGLSNWTESNIGNLNMDLPNNWEIFINSDYLIYIKGNKSLYNSLYKFYQSVVENLPDFYDRCAPVLDTFDSRFGQIVVRRIDKDCFSLDDKYEFINAMSNNIDIFPFSIFWKLEALQLISDTGVKDPLIYSGCAELQTLSQQIKDEYYLSIWEENYAISCNFR